MRLERRSDLVERTERNERQRHSEVKVPERVSGTSEGGLEKQVNGILRRELADRNVKREMVGTEMISKMQSECIERRKQLQILLDALEKSEDKEICS